MAEAVLVMVADGIAVVMINRPEARNAVNGEVARGIARATDELAARGDVRVLVLTGAGGNFWAGMELKGFLAGEVPTVAGRGFAGITERPPASRSSPRSKAMRWRGRATWPLALPAAPRWHWPPASGSWWNPRTPAARTRSPGRARSSARYLAPPTRCRERSPSPRSGRLRGAASRRRRAAARRNHAGAEKWLCARARAQLCRVIRTVPDLLSFWGCLAGLPPGEIRS